MMAWIPRIDELSIPKEIWLFWVDALMDLFKCSAVYVSQMILKQEKMKVGKDKVWKIRRVKENFLA